ncbi:MAG: hypothetical protein R3F42_15005 [Pseudomonadota bacterium]
MSLMNNRNNEIQLVLGGCPGPGCGWLLQIFTAGGGVGAAAFDVLMQSIDIMSKNRVTADARECKKY